MTRKNGWSPQQPIGKSQFGKIKESKGAPGARLAKKREAGFSPRVGGIAEASTRVALEEGERLLVELGDAFVDRGVGAGLEHDELAVLDARS